MNLPRLEPFKPRLWHELQSYSLSRLGRDVGAGVTVGVVALPLAMAFAIASGLTPEAGLWTAIIGGFLIAALGGSAVQIGGPAGAFIVIVYGIVEQYGVANLLICTASAGGLLFFMGWLRLGGLVRYVPLAVVIGFTNGIAVLIALSQLREVLGLSIANMPADFFSMLSVMGHNLHRVNPYALALGTACVLGLWAWPKWFQAASPISQRVAAMPKGKQTLAVTARVPGPVVALVSLSVLAWALNLPVETIGQRFGAVADTLPRFELPDFSWATVRLLVAPTLTLALLGAVESLLCARVADQVSGLARHNPNQELMAQGIANLVVPYFGGMPVTGTIARTVTNIRAGATSPVSGMVHALTLAALVLVAAPLSQHIPLAVLGGVLLFVAWNMGEWREFAKLRHFSVPYRVLLLSTFSVTVVFDLTVAVQLGLVLACVFFILRQQDIFRVYMASTDASQTIDVKLYGSLFFGTVGKLDTLLALAERCQPGQEVVLHAQRLITLDTTGLDALRQLADGLQRRGAHLSMLGVQPQPASLLGRSGFALRLHRLEIEKA